MTKTKRQLRAEAVERLRKLEGKAASYADYCKAMVDCPNGFLGQVAVTEIIDMLTDEEPPEVDAMGCIPFEKFAQNIAEGMQHVNECVGYDLAPNQPTSQSDAPKPAENAENDATKGELRDFDDSREKLEADVLSESASWLHTPYGFRKVRNWLDRQAAITINEVNHTYEFGCEACRAAQKRRIAELTAERDELKVEVDAYRGKYEDMEFIVPIDEAMKFTTDPPGYVKKALADLQVERDELQRKLDIAGRHEAESDQACDECKEHFDELLSDLTAERDELRAELAKRDKGIERLKRRRDELLAECEGMRDELDVLRGDGE